MPATYDRAFEALRRHLGTPVFLHVEAAVPGLGAGVYPITVLDWGALDADDQRYFTECQAIPLASVKQWGKKLVPVAFVGGENHPVEDFDEQCTGILLLDLAKGSGGECPVLFYESPDADAPVPFSGTIGALDIRPEDED